jgi:hypothetical protein
MRSPCCLCVPACVSPTVNYETSGPTSMKLGMAPEPISTAYFIKRLISLCVSVSPPIVARQRLGILVSMATNTRDIRRTVGCVTFYAVRVHIKEESVGHCVSSYRC